MMRLCVLCLIALCALSVLRVYRPDWAPFLRIAATVALVGSVLSLTVSVLSSLTDLWNTALSAESYTVLLRVLGAALITELCAGICRDSGETSLAGWVETVGRMEILVLALPLIQSITASMAELLGVGA